MSFVREKNQRFELTFAISLAERNETQGLVLDTRSLNGFQLPSWFVKGDHHPSKGDGIPRLKFCRANPRVRHCMGLNHRGSG